MHPNFRVKNLQIASQDEGMEVIPMRILYACTSQRIGRKCANVMPGV
jgi:hypothetical protein